MLRSDVILEHDVAAELACDGFCKVATIGVAVRNGIVTLSGTVANHSLRQAALRAAKRVFGVDGVDLHLRVDAAHVDPAGVAAAVIPGSSTVA